MAMTRKEWNQLQTMLPQEDRMSYEEYLDSQPKSTSTPAKVDSLTQFGPLGGLQSGAVAGVRGAETPDITPDPDPDPDPDIDPDIDPDASNTFTATDGKVFTDELAFATYQASLNTQSSASATAAQQAATAAATAAQEAAAAAEKKRREGQSAYSLLFSEFDRNGLGALVEPLKQFIQEGLSEAEFTLRLRETDAYKKRFAANAQRVAKGLRALSEAEYVLEEDRYQDVMRRYGLPETYYSRGEMGRQEGFEKLIAGDVSPVELEDRISIAQKRVLNANPEVTQALKQFYPDITNADILAYTLDPKNAIENIKRKVTASEIGAGAIQAGLGVTRDRAEELGRFGITGEQSRAGFQQISGGLQRGGQLAAIYDQVPYGQETAEQEIFGITGAQEARKQRQKITGLEKATFGGQTGITSGALARDRAGGY